MSGRREAYFTELSPNRVQISTVSDEGEHVVAEVNTRGCKPMTEKDREAFVELVVGAHRMFKEGKLKPAAPPTEARDHE